MKNSSFPVNLDLSISNARLSLVSLEAISQIKLMTSGIAVIFAKLIVAIFNIGK
jgi:hypothetical protein